MSEKLEEMLGKTEEIVKKCPDQEAAEKAMGRAMDFLAGALSTSVRQG